MPDGLPPGLHERLLTRALEDTLARLDASRYVTEDVDAAELADVLARHLTPLLRRALRERADARGEDEAGPATAAVELFDRAADVLCEPSERLAPPPRLLTAVLAPASTLAPSVAPPRPGVPLSTSALLVNGRDEHRIGAELARELASADAVDVLCSFVKWAGLRTLLDPLRALLERGGRVRLLTTAYLGATETRALDALAELGAEVRVSLDTRRTRLHAKAWLFRRASGCSTAYVGSSNLSAAALTDGLEWNVRLAALETPHLLDKFAATFDTYWEDGEFEPYERERFAVALRAERDAGAGPTWTVLDVRPYPHQQDILDRLEAERELHGSFRNLVVAATGTGKTVVAALDYRRARERWGARRLLFVAHLWEILTRSREVFRLVLGDGSFGELWVDGERPAEGQHVFASIQSLQRLDLSCLPPDAYDFVVVDEFHHAEAPTYARLLEHLRPKILLGLTATPERTDGQDVLRWFGGRVAAELRLWLALERGLLCPFQYFAHSDGVDLSGLSWTRGGYDRDELERALTGNDARDRVVLHVLRERVADVTRMRALGFCVSVAHARHMARVFEAAGIPAVAVDAGTPRDERDAALRRLRDREVNVVFAVNLFNEGVDVPEVDTVLFLRPTESATVFLQQLGRGLRLARDKACLTVLDFVGQVHRRFRWDLRLRALTGATRAECAAMVQGGFPVLPPGCSIQLDRVATERVLENIQATLGLGRRGLVQDLVDLAARRGTAPTLGEFLRETLLEPPDVYRVGSWTELRRAAGRARPGTFPLPEAGPFEEALALGLAGLLHVDDPERLALYRRLVVAPDPPRSSRSARASSGSRRCSTAPCGVGIPIARRTSRARSRVFVTNARSWTSSRNSSTCSRPRQITSPIRSRACRPRSRSGSTPGTRPTRSWPRSRSTRPSARSASRRACTSTRRRGPTSCSPRSTRRSGTTRRRPCTATTPCRASGSTGSPSR